jgi:hypothetical protein
MVLLHESVDSKKMDVRTVERNVSRGVIKAEDLAEAVKNLPDDSENAEWVSVDSLIDTDEPASSNGKTP